MGTDISLQALQDIKIDIWYLWFFLENSLILILAIIYESQCQRLLYSNKVAFREFTNLTFLKISVILSVNKEGVPLPLKVEH